MKILAPVIYVLLMSSALCSQDLKGQWNGTLHVQGTQFRIVFHVTKADNHYKATMDSPDQYVSGLPVITTSFSYPDVKFEIPTIGLVYEGTLSDDSITGKWMQAGQSFPLVLEKTENQSEEK